MAQLFYAYATQDIRFRDQLEAVLRGLQRKGVLEKWHARPVGPGSGWRGDASPHLKQADVILFLVSSDFLSSDYGYGPDVTAALERQRAGEARAMVVLLRPCPWKGTAFGVFPALPPGAKPISSAKSTEAAYEQIGAAITTAVNRLTEGDSAEDEAPAADQAPAAVATVEPAAQAVTAPVAAPAAAVPAPAAPVAAAPEAPAPEEVALDVSEIGPEYVAVPAPSSGGEDKAGDQRHMSVAALRAPRKRRVAQLVLRTSSPQDAVGKLEAAVRSEVAKGGELDDAPAAGPGVACKRVRARRPAPTVSVFAAKGPFLVAAKVIDADRNPEGEDSTGLANRVVRRMLERIPS